MCACAQPVVMPGTMLGRPHPHLLAPVHLRHVRTCTSSLRPLISTHAGGAAIHARHRPAAAGARRHLAGDTTAPDWQDSIGAPGQPPPAWRVLAASAGFNHSAAVIEVADGAALLEEQGPR